MTSLRPTVALYHHLPPGGADRAMYELTRRTGTEFRYVLYEVELDSRDPYHHAERSPMGEVVDETHIVKASAGGSSRLGRWSVTVPSILRAERRISASINQLRPDAIVVHHQRFLHAPLVLRRVEAPTVYFVQEPRRRSFEYALRNQPADGGIVKGLLSLPVAALETWARAYDIRTTRAASSILCNSVHSRESVWRSYGRDAEVVRLGVDCETFVLPDSGRDAGADPGAGEVLSVGSLDLTKGHDLAIEAVGKVDPAIRPRLRIIHNRDTPGAAEALSRLAGEHGVDLVLESSISDQLLVRRYQEASAVLLVGRVEPLGLTSLEATACGTPVVAVREGGYRETVLDGVTGYLTDRKAADLAMAITRVLRGELGESRKAIRASTLARFDWDRAAETYATSVRAAIESARSTH